MIVRQYGNILINLTSVISFEQIWSTLKFVCPISNHYQSRSTYSAYDSQPHAVKFNSETECLKEMISIKDALNNFYTK